MPPRPPTPATALASSSKLPLPPSKLHSTITKIRSTIFETLYNPTNTRSGSKYLRKKLIGPSIKDYYPSKIDIKALNKPSLRSSYNNWQGLSVNEWKEFVVSGLSGGASGQKSAEKYREGVWGDKVLLRSGGGGEGGIVAEGFREVVRIPGAGWVDDAKERMRMEEVSVRKAVGKGPPKKGQGRRSQMKKR